MCLLSHVELGLAGGHESKRGTVRDVEGRRGREEIRRSNRG
jgi:hypothetical protein